MQYTNLGSTGTKVSRVCLGCMTYGSKKWREWVLEEEEGRPFIKRALELGINFFDTADMYSLGVSEQILGRALKDFGPSRDRLVIATKVGMEMPGVGKGLRAARIRQAVEASLARLQVDRIDLYQAHAEDPDTPIEETLEAFDRLVRDGKVRAIGASNYAAPALAKALSVSAGRGWARYATLQPRYNLYSRAEFERDLQPLCVREGIGVIPYYGLASGFLTGKYRSEADLAQSARGAAVKQYLDERGMRILQALDEVAREARAKPAQVALAWLMARPAITAPIASATTLAQLRELMAAADLALDATSLARLDRASG